MVNHHGDCKPPTDPVLSLPHGLFKAYGGDPNYLLSGMILQVHTPLDHSPGSRGSSWYVTLLMEI